MLELLKSIPLLINLFSEIWAFIKKASGNDPAGFIKKSGEAIAELNKAETKEQKFEAAKKIQDLVRSL